MNKCNDTQSKRRGGSALHENLCNCEQLRRRRRPWNLYYSFSIQPFSCPFFFPALCVLWCCVCGALGCSLVGFGTIHDYYLHSAIIEGHCLICMWVRSHWVTLSFRFSLQFSYEDMLMAHHLEKRWKRLFLSALFRSEKLQPIKQKFADITHGEIEVFWDDVSWQSRRRLGEPDEEWEKDKEIGRGGDGLVCPSVRILPLHFRNFAFSAILFCFPLYYYFLSMAF